MKYLFLTLIALLSLQSCKDIKAKNISGTVPVLILPQKLDTILTNPVKIKWEEMEGATKYRLQIASPSFADITKYVLDTTITGTSYAIALDSNQFELKLTAINAGYTSQILGPIRFWVGKKATTTTGTLLVPLSTPADSCYKNKDFDGVFKWGQITGGTNYQFELRKGNEFIGATSILSLPASNSFQATLPSNLLPLSPGRYFWAVKGYVGSVEEPYSQRVFFIDTVRPTVPVIDVPTASSLQADSITFTWHYNPTNETFKAPVKSTIEIATDINFNTIYKSVTCNPAITSTKIKLVAAVGGTTYYCRIQNIDAAGNKSDYSIVKTLTITP